MSHFTVLVAGKDLSSGGLEKALAPFHEFECTGHVDEYVKDVDITEEALKEYADSTESKIRLADGTITDYDNHMAPMTLDEVERYKAKQFGEHGFSRVHQSGDKISHFVMPEGAERVELPTSQFEDFPTWVESYYGSTLAESAEAVDREGEHKHGFFYADGASWKVFRRTNPNAKWDWYSLGGRWQGMLKPKAGATTAETGRPGVFHDGSPLENADLIRKDEIDFDAMKAEAVDGRRKHWADMIEKLRAKGFNDESEEQLDQLRYRALQEKITWTAAWEQAGRQERLWDYMKEKMDERSYEAAGVLCNWLGSIEDSASFDKIEDYVNAAPPLETFAILVDGEWYEKGQMGWFACVSDAKDPDEFSQNFEERLKALPDDWELAVVDCHI